MADTLTKVKFFTILDWKKEQDYLRSMHRKGWKLEKVSGLDTYHFTLCEPEDVVYQLDYNPQGQENRDEYLRMFADCGWEYIQDYVGYSYFRKPAAGMQGDEQIFCDDESRLDMLRRVFRGRMIPLLVLFSVCLLPTTVLQFLGGRTGWGLVNASVLALYLVAFLRFGIGYYRFRSGLSRN